MVHHEPNTVASTTWRSNARVLGYCLIVGLAATAFGFDAGLTSGFLAMPQYVCFVLRREIVAPQAAQFLG
jgi:hypothetical protein